MLATSIDYLVMFYGFAGLLILGAVLGELSVWIAKILGYDFDDKKIEATDWIERLDNGEILHKDNMFNIDERKI